MDEATQIIVIASVFGGAWLVLLIIAFVLCGQVSSLRKKVAEMQANGRMRIQKLKMNSDKNHAFHNPALEPDEELSRRGYSMYMGPEDVESGRHERQTGGQFVDRQPSGQYVDRQPSGQFVDRQHPGQLVDRQHPGQYEDRQPSPQFVEELTRELDNRHQKPNNAPPFLLQSIQENKQKTRNLTNPHANNGRQSETNPNFIY